MAKTGAVASRPATPEECVATLGAKPGSLGAVAATMKSGTGFQPVNPEHRSEACATPAIFADERLRGANDMTAGANEDGFHFKNVSIERDIQVTQWFDLRTVNAGGP